MALLGFEGFDHSPSALGALGTDLQVKSFGTGAGGISGGIWTANGNVTRATGLSATGFAMSMTSNTQQQNLILSSTYVTLIAGFRIKTPNSFAATGNGFFAFLDTLASFQCGLAINTSGKLIFWRTTSGTVLATGSTTLSVSTVYHIGISATIDNSAGAVQVNLNGASEITASSLDTQNTAHAYTNGIQFLCGPGSLMSYDDFYLVDTTGSAPYNTFLGTAVVESVFPTSAVATAWTPNASTNVSQIQETANDGDSTFNWTSTSSNADTFAHAALASIPVKIFAAAVTVSAKKDDVTIQNIKSRLVSGATTQDGVSNPLDFNYAYYRDIYLNNPDTSAPWATKAAIDATAIGYEHV